MKKLLCILLLLFCIIGINSQTILTLGRVKVDGLNIARSGERSEEHTSELQSQR